MQPIDERVTAAHLMALRSEADASRQIGELLQIVRMEPLEGTRTRQEIDAFVETGDATLAAQLIHTAAVRRKVSKQPG